MRVHAVPSAACRCPCTAQSGRRRTTAAAGAKLQHISTQPCRLSRDLRNTVSSTVPLRLLRVARNRGQRLVAHVVDTETLLEDVRKRIAEEYGKKLEEVMPDTNFDDLGLDSLDTVELFIKLEEYFELKIDEDGAEVARSVQDVSDLIARSIRLITLNNTD
mmetsp:Transcript_9609/g.28935  ORF Transcript_9609/g.28935 Transcript_9609/m.28935 type:complete len:161 (+) Transcript_9609:252-734(+)